MLVVIINQEEDIVNSPPVDLIIIWRRKTASIVTISYSDHGTMVNGLAAEADSLGKIAFKSNTGKWFLDMQKQWFDYWLKGIGDGKFAARAKQDQSMEIIRCLAFKQASIKTSMQLQIIPVVSKPVPASCKLYK